MHLTHRRPLLPLTIAGLLALSGCAAAGGTSGPARSAVADPTDQRPDGRAAPASPSDPDRASTVEAVRERPSSVPGSADPVPAPTTTVPTPVSPFAKLVDDLAPAVFDPQQQVVEVNPPVQLSVPSIRVEDATIVPVGVLDDGRFEVPDARLVGWYRFGPAPGDDGVTVLAAHLNYDGVDGVFRRLGNVDIGAEIQVVSQDGSARTYRVTDKRLIDKTQLPPEEIWARSGPPRLVLITCGGRYDAERRGYDDNVVVFAEPVS